MGTLQFAASSYSVAESGGSVQLTVTRNGGSSGAASVSYATANGTPIAGTIYRATSGTLNWADRDAATKSIVIPVINANQVGGTQYFTATLSGPTGGATLV